MQKHQQKTAYRLYLQYLNEIYWYLLTENLNKHYLLTFGMSLNLWGRSTVLTNFVFSNNKPWPYFHFVSIGVETNYLSLQSISFFYVSLNYW